MNIAIEGTIIKGEITGTGFYIANLINGLAKIDDLNNYYIFGDKEFLDKYLKISKKNIKIVNMKFRSRVVRVLWEYFIFPFNLKKLRIDVVHSPNYITPLFKLGFKIILTVHDLTFLLFPEKHATTKRLLFSKMIPIFIKLSDKIIAVSENTKKDMLKFFNISKNKISVTYEGYPDYYNCSINENEAKKILKKYGIEKNFILYIGMIEPRKNIISILRAFKVLDEEIELDLVIVGRKGWYYNEIEQFMINSEKMKIKNNIIFTGYIPEEELKYFYKSAYVFVYPSLYEGFGLPPLQAMACGTPVITSNISSLPEVVGDAAIKINPENLDELVDSIRLIYNDEDYRDVLSQKGLERSKLFDLEIIAKKTLDIYKSVQ